MKLKKYHKAIIAIVLGALFGGGNGTFNKIGLSYVPPFIFLTLRLFLSLIFISPFFLKQKAFSRKNFKFLVLTSLLASANSIFFLFGIRLTTAIVSMMLYAAGPMFVYLFSYFILREKIVLTRLIGILIGFSGIIMIILLPVIESNVKIRVNLFGNLLIFAGVICFSLYKVLSKKIQKYYSPLSLTAFFIALTLVIVFPFGVGELLTKTITPESFSLPVLGSLLYVSFFGMVAAYLLIQYSIKHSSPVISSAESYLSPLFGIGWAMIFLNEKPSPSFLLGGSLALIGVYLVTQNRASIKNIT